MTLEQVIEKMMRAKTLAECSEAWEARKAYYAKNEEEVDILAGYGETLFMLQGALERLEREDLLIKAS